MRNNFEERNNEKIQRLLERDPFNTRAVIANTIETKKISGKLTILDRIFNSVRQKMGFDISFKDAESILKQFETIEKTMDSIIDEAVKKEIIKVRPKEVKLNKVKTDIIALIKKGSTVEEIAAKYELPIEKAEGWLSTIYGEMPELKPKPIKTEEVLKKEK